MSETFCPHGMGNSPCGQCNFDQTKSAPVSPPTQRNSAQIADAAGVLVGRLQKRAQGFSVVRLSRAEFNDLCSAIDELRQDVGHKEQSARDQLENRVLKAQLAGKHPMLPVDWEERTPVVALIQFMEEAAKRAADGTWGMWRAKEFEETATALRIMYESYLAECDHEVQLAALRSQQSVPPKVQALSAELREYADKCTQPGCTACSLIYAAADFIVRQAARIQELELRCRKMANFYTIVGQACDEAHDTVGTIVWDDALADPEFVAQAERGKAAITAALSKEGT